MILERLVVENFRPYRDRHEVEFARPGADNVTVIRGLNGTGKSSLFMALKWCFGGRAPVDMRHLTCMTTLRDAAPHSVVDTRVETTYSHEGRRFKAVRSFRTHVGERDETGEPSFNPEPTASFQLFELSVHGEASLVEAPYDELRDAVPSEALDYFFFDAERISNFAADSDGGAIREAIREVLRFVELEHAIKHVDSARQEYARKLKGVAGANAAELSERREKLFAESGVLRERLEGLNTEIAAAKQVRDEQLAHLRELTVVRELAEERAALSAQKEDLGRQREDAITGLAGGLPGLALTLADDALRIGRDLVEAKRARGEIPPKVKAQVLRDWLDAGMCICGRPLHPGSTEHATIESELERTMPGRLQDELSSLRGNIDASAREAKRQLEAERVLLARLNQARELLLHVNDRYTEVEKELRKQPDEDVNAITARLHRQDTAIEDGTTRIGEITSSLVRAQQEIDRLTADIAKAEAHNREAQRVGRRHDLAMRTVEALRDLKSSFENDVRAEVESEASRLFRELIWKTGYYEAVTLSPTFRLEALDRWGEPAFSTGGTSMGEARVLSIAFIVAMQVVARASFDTQSPTVIDSPFGNLSIEPMQKICERLPALVDQVVLFLTETDWRSVSDVLRPRMGRSYDLVFDEPSSLASVVEGVL